MSLLYLIPAQYRLLAAGLAVAVLMGLAASGGAWLAAGHYRPLLDKAQDALAKCAVTRDSLESAVGEQNAKVAQLRDEAEKRREKAALAASQARIESAPDYAAANRIQRERIGGDQCVAATTVIDQELGL